MAPGNISAPARDFSDPHNCAPGLQKNEKNALYRAVKSGRFSAPEKKPPGRTENTGVTSKSAIPAILTAVMVALTSGAATAQEDILQTPGKPLRLGDVISGHLDAMHVRGRKGDAFQLSSEPRRLPPPHLTCDLMTGPQTFELVTHNDAEVTQLKGLMGHVVSIKVGEISCADAVGQLSEAVISQWRVVKTRAAQ